MPSELTRTVDRLTEGDPSEQELLDCYHVLRTAPGGDDADLVGRFALAQVVGEFLDYLDLVSAEFEKSVGLSADAERRRILAELSAPTSSDAGSVAAVADVVTQWRAIERYTVEDIVRATAESRRA